MTIVETVTASDGTPKGTITPEMVSQVRHDQPDKLRRKLSGDLDNIVLMALRKEPQRRYNSAEQFAEDLRRHLEGLPVIARQDTFTYRSSKFIRRHRAGVVAAALVALSLIAGMGSAVWQARIAAQQRDAVRVEKAKAESINDFLMGLLSFSNPEMSLPNIQKGHEVTVRDVLDATGPLIKRELADQPEVKAAIQRTIGNSYSGIGQYDLAEKYLRLALESDLRLYGENHPETVKCLVPLVTLMMNKADSAGAEALYQKLIPIYRRQQQQGKVKAGELLTVLNGYSVLVRLRGNLKESEALLREALGLAASLPATERTASAYVRLNLALVRADQGDLAEAVQMNRAAVSEYRQIQGREPLKLGMSLTALGDELTALNQLAEAEADLREGEAIFRKLIIEAHPTFATNLCFQGNLFYRKGEYVEAEKKTRRSIELYHQSGAEAYQHYATALTTLGLILNRTDRIAQAEATLREAVNLRTRSFPKGHYKTARTLGALGECLMTQHRYDEAEGLFLTSYADLKASQGEQHPTTREALQHLVALYDAWGKTARADEYRARLPAEK